MTEFLGYDTETAEGQIVALVSDGQRTDAATAGASVLVVVNQTPFYAEAGGQVGDSGTLATATGRATITDTRKTAGVFIHFAEVTEGRIATGQGARLEVDHARRTAIRANHSATHLLHEALREALGDHVAQRGSLNAPDRLRFDFSHARALITRGAWAHRGRGQCASSGRTRRWRPASWLPTRPARSVRRRSSARSTATRCAWSRWARRGTGKGADGRTYSIELCGGTHVRRTGDIGLFVALGDSASSAGVRRIEALTGEGARRHVVDQARQLAAAAAALKSQPGQVAERVQALVDERRSLQNEVAQLRRELALSGGAGTSSQAPRDMGGVAFVSQVLNGVSGKDLPALVDEHKARLGSGAVLLIAEAGGKAAVAAGVTSDLVTRVSAVDLVSAAVGELGGKGGGGRPDMAQGGGRDAVNADAAIEAAVRVIEG